MDQAQMIEKLIQQGEQLKTLFKRMDDLEKLTDSVNKLAISMERLTEKQTATERRVEGLGTEVDELRQKPAKRWETVVTAIISALVGAGIALLIK